VGPCPHLPRPARGGAPLRRLRERARSSATWLRGRARAVSAQRGPATRVNGLLSTARRGPHGFGATVAGPHGVATDAWAAAAWPMGDPHRPFLVEGMAGGAGRRAGDPVGEVAALIVLGDGDHSQAAGAVVDVGAGRHGGAGVWVDGAVGGAAPSAGADWFGAPGVPPRLHPPSLERSFERLPHRPALASPGRSAPRRRSVRAPGPGRAARHLSIVDCHHHGRAWPRSMSMPSGSGACLRRVGDSAQYRRQVEGAMPSRSATSPE
jgi:hypothetical protein